MNNNNIEVELKRLEQFYCHECDADSFEVCDACDINCRIVELESMIDFLNEEKS